MSIADEANKRTMDDLIDRVAQLVGVPIMPSGWHQMKNVVDVLEASERLASGKPEAAPSDTDREALTLIARDVHLYDGGDHQALSGRVAQRIADAALAAGFSRTSQPVQVEVTAEIAKWADYFEHFDSTVGAPTLDGATVARLMRGPRPFGAVAALGGGDHAE